MVFRCKSCNWCPSFVIYPPVIIAGDSKKSTRLSKEVGADSADRMQLGIRRFNAKGLDKG